MNDPFTTESQVVNRWIKEAEDKARLEQARTILLLILEDRFPGQTSTEVASTINAQPSLSLLRDWVKSAYRVGTFDDFLAVLRQ